MDLIVKMLLPVALLLVLAGLVQYVKALQKKDARGGHRYERQGALMSSGELKFFRALEAAPAINPVVTLIVDDYEGDAPDNVLDVFRTPSAGPAHLVAWHEGHGARTATVTSGLDGQAAWLTAIGNCFRVYVPLSALP